jgi:cobalt-zinc-cadmium efflux system membrane fusion protein
VTWISTAVDDQTRTLRVRADIENPEGRLRDMTFGKAEITVRQTPDAIVVPNEAIQWEGCCYVVFVRLTDDIFQTRKVKLGAKDSVFTEVLVGAMPGEVVVTTGSHVLKSEILKSNLGAGCCDIE